MVARQDSYQMKLVGRVSTWGGPLAAKLVAGKMADNLVEAVRLEPPN